ncbi:MAG TPA: hypothetical protein VM143_01405 [Acidimicrobiales bacterium]|nr:hypothetical protein [Acidimicrobiales bacterium]
MKLGEVGVGIHGCIAVAMTGAGDDLGVVVRGVVPTRESLADDAERLIELAGEAAAARATSDLRQIIEESVGAEVRPEGGARRQALGPPWRKEHEIAATAALHTLAAR